MQRVGIITTINIAGWFLLASGGPIVIGGGQVIDYLEYDSHVCLMAIFPPIMFDNSVGPLLKRAKYLLLG